MNDRPISSGQPIEAWGCMVRFNPGHGARDDGALLLHGARAPLVLVAADRVNDLIPFVQVADVKRSIEFYELLGFAVSDTYVHEGKLDFAALESGSARTMLVRAAGRIDPREQKIRFYLYTEDLDSLRKHLAECGVCAGPIVDGTPGPKREMTVHDPDGYCLMIAEID